MGYYLGSKYYTALFEIYAFEMYLLYFTFEPKSQHAYYGISHSPFYQYPISKKFPIVHRGVKTILLYRQFLIG
jgi:hypothetical protein